MTAGTSYCVILLTSYEGKVVPRGLQATAAHKHKRAPVPGLALSPASAVCWVW